MRGTIDEADKYATAGHSKASSLTSTSGNQSPITITLVANLYPSCRFDAEHPGVVFFKTRINDPEQKFVLCKNASALPKEKPPALPPPGLDYARRDYLFRNIRQFVPDEFKDTMCPNPNKRKDIN